MLAAFAVGGLVAAAVIAVGGVRDAEVWLLAGVSGATFGDLMRRGYSERASGRGDPTDLLMSLAFVAVILGGAYDLGRASSYHFAPSLTATVGARLAGLVVIAVGLLVRQRAASTLGDDFLVRLGLRAEHRLVATGPYRRVRHPTYGALLLVALGTALALESPIALAATVFFWLPITLVRIEREERLMVERFGTRYESFRRRTWRLVPWVY